MRNENKNQNGAVPKDAAALQEVKPEIKEKIEKKRAEVCAALTNMAAICLDERLSIKEGTVHIEHIKKVLTLYFEILLEKIDALKYEVI